MNYQQFLFEEIHNQKQQPWRSWCYGLMVAMRESPHSLGLLSISSESDSMLVDAGITTMCWISSRWAIQIRLKTHTHDSSWHSKKVPHEETYLFLNIVHKFWFKNTFDLVSTNSSSSNAIYSIKFEHPISEIWFIYWHGCKCIVARQFAVFWCFLATLHDDHLIAAVNFGIENVALICICFKFKFGVS